LAVVGRYILTSDIMAILARQEPGRGGEIQLTDAIRKGSVAYFD
jgi:UTP--glucose-1-phosphate uridylyltransferase